MSATAIVMSTIGGIIFFYVLYTYESRDRIRNTVLAIIAALFDTYPVYTGEMTQITSEVGALHMVVTIVAYLTLCAWAITYKKVIYRMFWFIWVAAYLTGYLVAFT